MVDQLSHITKEELRHFVAHLLKACSADYLSGPLANAVEVVSNKASADSLQQAATTYALAKTLSEALETQLSLPEADGLSDTFLTNLKEGLAKLSPSITEQTKSENPITLPTNIFCETLVVRHPNHADLENLCELERACWPTAIAADRTTLQRRIDHNPTDHLIIEIDGELAGAMYTQPISERDALLTETATTVHHLRDENGSLVQLLALNVFPDRQHLGLGDRLLELMLHHKREQGFERAVAVTRCKNYPNHRQLSPEHYIRSRTAQKMLVDPILRFHEAHGAEILSLVPGYRPGDEDNLGNGVLIAYDLLSRQHRVASERGAPFDIQQVENHVRALLGDRASRFSPHKALMDLGLDSLDLNGLVLLLEPHLAEPIDPTFFFRYPTTSAIARYMNEGDKTKVTAPVNKKHIQPQGMNGAQSKRPDGEGIAIIGIACRFPGGANNPDAYWNLLRNGVDAIGEVPRDRWDIDAYYDADRGKPGKMVSRYGGFLDDVRGFDAEFFAMAPREAANTDPQQRLLLELSWEALEDAGMNPQSLVGSRTGVFAGIFTHDYELLAVKNGAEQQLDTYYATGNSASVAAGRISYALGLEGPALAVDTACSSSLVAVHLACRSLREGESETALALGVNLILSPELTITFSRAGMLSEDGRCRTFDAAASGYVRGEGAGGVVLKTLDAANRDGNRILGIIRGSAINQDGASNGLTAPNQTAQELVIRQALTDAKLEPHQISYVEAHGTGTSIGDPIEVNALKAVYGQARNEPLVLGSVKTNIGHTEGAAGMAGLIKVLLAMKHRYIPKHLHFQQANPLIPFDSMPIRVANGEAWHGNRLLAGVSSFGFSGTNAHAIIEAAPAEASQTDERDYELLLLSAKNEASLKKLADAYAVHPTTATLAEICHTANLGRAHFDYRMAIVSNDLDDLKQQLESDPDDLSSRIIRGKVTKAKRKIGFLFSGQGSQYPGMGRVLYQSQPVFRQVLDQCDAHLRQNFDLPLLDILFAEDERLHDTRYTQPALYALEYGLAKLWQSWGIEPDVVMGHSVGEYVAATLAGVFSLEDGLSLIAHRGALMGNLPEGGGMTAIFATEAEVSERIAPYSDRVSIAALNGPKLTVIAGAMDALQKITDELAAQGIRYSQLQVSHAFHSPLMEPMLDEFARQAARITYHSPQLPLISNVSGEIAGNEIASADYWVRHISAPVRFAPALKRAANDHHLFLEIGPHPVLCGMGRRIASDPNITWLPSLDRGRSDWQQLLKSAATLYVEGAALKREALETGRVIRPVSLPTYPFARTPHWLQGSTGLATRMDKAQILRDLKASKRFQPKELSLAPKLLAFLADMGKQRQETAKQEPTYQITWQAAPQENPSAPDFLPSPDQLAGREQCTLPAAATGQVEDIEALATRYILDAFRKLEWQFEVGSRFTTDEVIERLGIQPAHGRLLRHLLGFLAQSGFLEHDVGSWRTLAEPAQLAPGPLLQRMREDYPELEAELTLLENCGGHLAEVLRGMDPIPLIFPSADTTLATRLYQTSPSFGHMNEQMRRTFANLIEDLPKHRRIRILEIGAGTGGTTAHMLPLLPAENTTYTFTDLGRLFLDRARERFDEYPFMDYRILDIEKCPLEQGFQAEGYDIILASNVLHATKDLRNTMRHVRQVLAPGGYLLLLEGSAQRRWIDLIFGLLSGWSAFIDEDLRGDYPLLNADTWNDVFQETGFLDATAFRNDALGEALFPQAVYAVRNATETTQTDTANWLIFADENAVAEEVAENLGGATLVYPGKQFARQDNRFHIDPTHAEDMLSLLKEVMAESPVEGILYLWGQPGRSLESSQIDVAQLQREASVSSRGLIHLVQALHQCEDHPVRQLLIAGEGAQKNPGSGAALPQSLLWGLGRVIISEYPALGCRMIDLDPNLRDRAAQILQSELEQQQAEPFIAYSEGRRLAARFERAQAPEHDQSVTDFKADATYLVTGASGGIAKELLPWMVERGVRHLALIGRKTPSADLQKLIATCESMGASVRYLQADVAELEQLRAAFSEVETHMPPLRGVIHAAGIMNNHVLARLQWQDFERVITPKVYGAWNLHLLTEKMPLDHFVLFSSIISMIGGSGIANYVAANSFLDALALFRQAHELPAQSISWGPWLNVGMLREDRTANQLESQGLTLMEPEKALAILGHWIGTKAAHVGVVEMEAARFVEAQPTQLHGYFEQLDTTGEDDGQQAKRDLVGEIKEASAERRRELLAEHLSKMVAAVLGFDSNEAIDPDMGFFQMGMDSLTSMELRNRLQTSLACAIPETQLLKYPTVNEFTDYLCRDIFDEGPPNPSVSPAEQPAATVDSPDASNEPQSLAEEVARELESLENILKALR